jgi:TolB-like protein/DNA-binding winged helix-turn-helix (wHTH) protein/cytochrome c-type biogenesis protein CcmH/NrfG
LDLDGGFLRRGDDEVTLSPKAFEVLTYLVERHGRLVTKNALIAAVWPDTAITDNSLAQRVVEIRRALRDDSQQMIRTVSRRGYVFAEPVTLPVVEFPRHQAEPGPAPLPVSGEKAEEKESSPAVPLKLAGPWRRRLKYASAVGAIVTIALAATWFLRGGASALKTPPPAAITSVAVLPFTNLTGDKEQDYVGDALTEEITYTLSRAAGLRVASRTSASRFRGGSEDIRQIAKLLNVSSVLEGSVRRSGDNLTITAQLINGADGFHLWSEKYERPVRTAFASQEDIALAVLTALRVRPPKTEPASPRIDAEAYDLYIRGVLNRGRGGTAAAAIEYFEKAIRKEPRFARAYAGIAGAYLSLAIGSEARPRDVLPKAKEMIAKALSIDPNLPEAYVSQAVIERHERNWPGVERAWRRAIELYPSIPRHDYALHLADMGRAAEALAEVARLRKVDPLAATDHLGLEAKIFYFDRKYDLALDRCRKALAASPDNWEILYWLGRTRASQSSWTEAIEALEKSRRLRDHYRGLGSGMLGAAYAYAGRRSEARKVLEQLKDAARQRKASPLSVAHIYVSLGETDQAFEWLRRAADDNDSGLATLRVEPAFDPIRTDPRFISLLRSVNLAE